MRKTVTINAGEYMASDRPITIKTILGSCVAVCLYDPIRKIGGMNHIFLPGKADLKHFDTAARYGVNAMELLINKMLKLGAKRHAFIAKTFGGANVLSTMTKSLRMGDKNAAFVLEFLKIEGIKVVGGKLGGTESRKIFFHTDTGTVFLKRLDAIQSQKVLQDQEKKKAQIEKEAQKSGPVTWFQNLSNR